MQLWWGLNEVKYTHYIAEMPAISIVFIANTNYMTEQIAYL